MLGFYVCCVCIHFGSCRRGKHSDTVFNHFQTCSHCLFFLFRIHPTVHIYPTKLPSNIKTDIQYKLKPEMFIDFAFYLCCTPNTSLSL